MTQKRILLFCILLLTALAVHVPGLTFHSLWFDETSTAYITSQHGFGSLFKALYTFEGTPPLFYVLEKSFAGIFFLAPGEFSMRFLPMLFTSLSCVLIYYLFREITGRRTALLAFALVTVSNFFIYLSHEARCYSLLSFMAMFTLWLVIQWWKKPGLLRSVALCLSVALTVQVHYYSLFWIASLWCSVFIVKPRDRSLLIFLVMTGVTACVSFLSLTVLFMTQFQHEVGAIRSYLTANWFVGIFYAPVKVLIGAYLFKIYEIERISRIDMLGILPCAVILVAAGYYLYARMVKKAMSDPEKIMLLAAIFAFLLHASFGSKIPTIHPRYMAHFLILLFGFVCLAFDTRKKTQMLVFGVLLVLNIIATIKFYDRSRAYIEPWKEISAAVDSAVVAGRSQTAGAEAGGPITGNFLVCQNIAFYMKNKSVEFRCFPPCSTRVNFARLTVFGETFYSPLFHYDFYPVAGNSSFIDVINEQKHGILLSEDRSSTVMLDDLKSRLGGKIEFSGPRIFKTNQGEVSIRGWNSKERY
jgi:hypothetical protein